MKNKDLLNGLIDLIEENNNLKSLIRELKAPAAKISDNSSVDEPNEFSDIIKTIKDVKNELEVEMQYYYIDNNVLNSWYVPKVEVKEDSGKMNFLTYEQWVKSLDYDCLNSKANCYVNKIGFKEFVKIFDAGLRKYYENLLNDAKGKVLRDAKEANN